MSLLPIGRRGQSRRRRGGARAVSGTLLLTLLASLAGQTGAEAAAPAAPITAAVAPATGASAPTEAAGPQATPTPDPTADNQAAVRTLQQSSDLAEPCPAAIAPHTVVNCTVDPSKTASFSLALPQQKDLVMLQVVATQASTTKLIAPGGGAVTCESVRHPAYTALRCPTGQAGTYTVQVTDKSSTANGISVSYTPLLSSTGCKAVGAADHRLGAPTVLHRSLSAGSAGDCYTLDLVVGDVLRTYSSSPEVLHSVYDASGTEVCTSRGRLAEAVDCKLTGTAPFRISALQSSGNAVDYDYTAARLSKPEGCAVVEPQAYGSLPDLTRTEHCRILRVTQAAEYTYADVVASGSRPLPSAILSEAGETVSSCLRYDVCNLAPGDYTWSADPKSNSFKAFGIAFHSARETRGCTATHDNGLAAGPATGTFTAPGHVLCLTLPTASGKGVYVLNRPPTGGSYAAYTLYDASGTRQQCDSGAICKLAGTAPFRAVLRSSQAPATFGLVFHRTGEAEGCTPWPQSAFGNGTWGAEVSVAFNRSQACLSVPGNAHSTAELLDHVSGNPRDVTAKVKLVDAAGNVTCETTSTSAANVCSLAPGEPFTALLESWATASGGTETYRLVRRDVSATAQCGEPPSTKTGGPSLAFDLTSLLDTRCVRLNGAATDKFWIAARTPAVPYYDAAPLTVVDGDGRAVCLKTGSCRVAGSTSYLAIIGPEKAHSGPVAAKLDTWRVGTASGWAPECTANRVSVNDFPTRSGTLSEASTAYCAVIDMRAGQTIAVTGTTSTTEFDKPGLDLMSGPGWTSETAGYGCTADRERFAFSCATSGGAAPGQAVLLLSPKRARTPVDFSFQGECREGCVEPPAPNPTGISPSTSMSGTRTDAIVSGIGLTFGSKLKLVRDGFPERVLEPVTANTDGKQLHVKVDTNGLEPGQYDLLLDGVEYTPGVPSRGYLPKAYTVTAQPLKGSRFVPLGPSRFLDTRDGTGATKQRVGPGGVVTLQVAGVKGIPESGVTAVVMNVTAVQPTEAGHVMVYPNGQPTPKVSNLNFAPGQIVPNLVTVPVVNGKVDLRNNAGFVDLIADVTGYYTDKTGAGSALNPITPARFLDTRDGTGAQRQRVGPGGVVTLQVAGVKGIPASGVTAVIMNVTAVQPTEAGHVTVYPNGQAAPGVSNLNFTPGQIVPNLVTVPVVNGKVDLRNNSGTVDLIADVTGYYAATGSAFSAAGPVRLLDTRDGTGARAGAVGPGDVVRLQVTGTAGVPVQGVTAVVLNVTVTNPTEASHLIVHPHGIARPGVSNLNYTPGQTVANLVVVPVVDGWVTFYNNSGSTDVIADLNGYFTS
ncbi:MULTISPECIES: hypothetical protein [Streptomyces]|uniref:hypothetical protein n=1 Tax=Streptomyces TaxID=1883 RepID=UPI001675E25C|nr:MULTISPECIES: hypothetical protein [Streptomyces]MBD3575579.1 hypothetical protein [Streptomyces sp. KD18]GGT21811.1 hypothetical protein GCM10010286_54130 [Streptomyces toxytricini]